MLSAPATTPSSPEHARATRTAAESVLLVAATVVTGLMAGFFYAYACSVMIGLARTDDATFVSTMQWINATVRNIYFGPAFFGALLLTAAAAVVTVVRNDPGKRLVVAAAVLYAGAFVVTFGASVPLNDQLAAAGAVDTMRDPAAVRAAYEAPWTTWNTVRTILSTASLTALATALLRHRR